MAQSENFRDKYTKPGRVGGVLVDRFYAAVRELLRGRISEADTVLEIGAGEGFSTQRIMRMLPAAVHFEASELRSELVHLARQRNPGVPVSQESIYKLNRKASSFDFVLCLEVLEHLEDPRTALSEIARVSRKYAMVSVPREPIWRALNLMRGKYIGDFGNTPGHIQHWSAKSFRYFVEPVFTVLEMRTPLPWTILLLKRKP